MRIPDGRPMPVAIAHPSPAYRRGLAAAFNGDEFRVEDPTDVGRWLQPGRMVVVADGSEHAVLAARPRGALVVVLLPDVDPDRYRRVLAAGADGVAHVDSQPVMIADIAQSAVAGEIVLPAEVARRLAGRPRPTTIDLSAEERRMLQRLSEGATIVQLAEEFYLAERSVRRRLQNIYVRLGASGRAEALKLVSQLGLVE